jgi:hypothetical protein
MLRVELHGTTQQDATPIQIRFSVSASFFFILTQAQNAVFSMYQCLFSSFHQRHAGQQAQMHLPPYTALVVTLVTTSAVLASGDPSPWRCALSVQGECWGTTSTASRMAHG